MSETFVALLLGGYTTFLGAVVVAFVNRSSKNGSGGKHTPMDCPRAATLEHDLASLRTEIAAGFTALQARIDQLFYHGRGT